MWRALCLSSYHKKNIFWSVREQRAGSYSSYTHLPLFEDFKVQSLQRYELRVVFVFICFQTDLFVLDLHWQQYLDLPNEREREAFPDISSEPDTIWSVSTNDIHGTKSL